MPRRARIVLPGVPLHLIQRGNNRQACFYCEDDYRFCLEWRGNYARDCACAVHAYVLGSYRYLELSPVRAAIVQHPGEYRWSSYRASAHGEPSSVVRPHECYLGLGAHEQTRQTAYRVLFRYQLDPGLVDEIREATNGNYALGSARFREQVAKALGRRVVRGRSGRPKKDTDTAIADLFGNRRQ